MLGQNDFLPQKSFKSVIQNIKSNFFTMDIAKQKNGDWIIMELGDGQVSGLADNVDKALFYNKFRVIL
ncbi:MAG: ATP-grasp domain-containing protein [Saprospiraceae bacterium]